MKFRSSMSSIEHHHIFAYGYPGSGKTKIARDYYDALGPGVISVTNEVSEATFSNYGVDIPILEPETQDELRAIITMPEKVHEKIIVEQMGYDFPKIHTVLFDNLRMSQLMVFGEGARKEVKVFDGAITLPAVKESGIMALPNKRDFAGLPSNKDYRFLDMEMRKIVDKIDRMPCHTIVTAHAEEDFAPRTRLELSGIDTNSKDGKREFMEVSKDYSGYPSLEGFALKADLAGLVSDLFLYLFSDGTSFYVCPKPVKGFMARTRMAEVMPKQYNWTDKNMYKWIEGKRKDMKERK